MVPCVGKLEVSQSYTRNGDIVCLIDTGLGPVTGSR